MIRVYFDGACEPINPGGIATFGYVIYRDDEKIIEGKGIASEPLSSQTSNNVAEYTALINALEWLIANNYRNDNIHIYGDSQLTIRQMTGKYAVKAERLLPLYARAQQLAKQFDSIKFQWIPREANEEADKLTHQAYNEYIESDPAIKEKIEPLLATDKPFDFVHAQRLFDRNHTPEPSKPAAGMKREVSDNTRKGPCAEEARNRAIASSCLICSPAANSSRS